VDDATYPPSLLVTGATAAIRGSPHFATFAAGNFAKRALSQSLGREFGPKGIHVAHIIIDGVINKTPSAQRTTTRDAEDAKLSPDAVSRVFYLLFIESIDKCSGYRLICDNRGKDSRRVLASPYATTLSIHPRV
jgi:NAD(P)-dependent dehydrogenase (short-subunit alcohol dehydrogenase family)